MVLASTHAGLAFTRSKVGYVHAIAHLFGSKYQTPHGLANGICCRMCWCIPCRRSRIAWPNWLWPPPNTPSSVPLR